MAMSVVELLRFPTIGQPYLNSHIRIRPGDKEKITPFLIRGEGIIFLTAHFGSWELLNATGSLMGYQMAVLAKEQKHRRADEFLNKLRSSKGTQVIYKGMAVREILRSLKRGQIVGMLSDQDGGKKGVFVRFFGRMSSSPAGVATFAMRTDTPIFPVFIFREGLNRHRVEVEGPLNKPSSGTEEEQERIILQQFSEILEQKIRQAPDQWLWAHRRWKSTPNRNVLILDDGKAGHAQQSMAFMKILASERVHEGCDPKDFSYRIVTVRYRSKMHSMIYRTLGVLSFGW
jgi:KDO2-lipid IV(A) lauroyltransferase